jgi:hypothetical protein
VAICPVQASGVFALKHNTVKVRFFVLGNPFTYNKAVLITESQLYYAFGNALLAVDSRKV